MWFQFEIGLCLSGHVLVGGKEHKSQCCVCLVCCPPGVCPTAPAAALGVLWVIGRQSLGLCISPFLEEVLEGSCIHFHLYFVEKYKSTLRKQTDTESQQQNVCKCPKKALAWVWQMSYGTLQAPSKI